LLLVVFSDLRLGEWPWWLGTIGGLLAVLAVAVPPLKSVPVDDDHIEVIHSRSSGMAHASR
jgi:predicted lysophospholipase L1 biosynthesis ABC-type transport system permease subunit